MKTCPRHPALNSWGDHDRDNPFPLFAEVRTRGPVQEVTLADGHGAWLVTRHDEARRREHERAKTVAEVETDPALPDGGFATREADLRCLHGADDEWIVRHDAAWIADVEQCVDGVQRAQQPVDGAADRQERTDHHGTCGSMCARNAGRTERR